MNNTILGFISLILGIIGIWHTYKNPNKGSYVFFDIRGYIFAGVCLVFGVLLLLGIIK